MELKLKGQITNTKGLSGSIHAGNSILSAEVTKGLYLSGTAVMPQIIKEVIETYEETYTVIPKSSSQILNTKDKKMIDDVTIMEIPYFSVENEAHGDTITIGG